MFIGSAMHFGPSGFSSAWKETGICLRGDVSYLKEGRHQVNFMHKLVQFGYSWLSVLGKISSDVLQCCYVIFFIHFRLFPTDLFELFIDVGHYVRDLTAYDRLQTRVSLYTVRKQILMDSSVYSAGFRL